MSDRNVRTRLRRWGVALAAGALAAALGACSADDPQQQPTDDVALVVAAHSGAPAVPAELVREAVAPLDAEGDRITVVSADGEPQVVLEVTLAELPGSSLDREDYLSAVRDRVVDEVTALRADTPEVDLDQAISLAAEGLRSESGTRRLVVLGGGLSTSGAMSMLEGRLYADPADMVAAAGQDGGLPDLSGVGVSMPRLAVTTSPQPALDEAARRALTAIWDAYLAAAGAQDADLAPAGRTAQPQEDAASLPTVTPVPVVRPEPAPVARCVRTVTPATLGFEQGSAVLADEAAALEELAAVVASLEGCEGAWTVGGSASSEGDPQANEALSGERAAAGARLLQQLPTLNGQVVSTRAWGTGWPCRVDDLDDQGRLVLGAAIANRVLVVSRGDTGC